jgi:hypothetical protein
MLRTAAAFALKKYGNKNNSNGKSKELLTGIYAKKAGQRFLGFIWIEMNPDPKSINSERLKRFLNWSAWIYRR